MAIFTNVATLTYDGRSTTSNVVTGQLQEILSGSKTALRTDYSAGDSVTYVISLVNSGTSALTGLTVTDDLGAYEFDGDTLYPLTYIEDSAQYYVNGVLQAAPTVTAGPPLTFSAISIPAGGNVIIIYEAEVNSFAPAGAGSSIVNNVEVSGGGLNTPLELSETINTLDRAQLTITKSLSPTVVAENGQLTYTFVIANYGNTPATVEDAVVLTDTFDPILDLVSVTFNGAAWSSPANYTYDEATGEFATVAGQITVPAATYTQNADGTFTVNPGISTLVVTGTV